MRGLVAVAVAVDVIVVADSFDAASRKGPSPTTV